LGQGKNLPQTHQSKHLTVHPSHLPFRSQQNHLYGPTLQKTHRTLTAYHGRFSSTKTYETLRWSHETILVSQNVLSIFINFPAPRKPHCRFQKNSRRNRVHQWRLGTSVNRHLGTVQRLQLDNFAVYGRVQFILPDYKKAVKNERRLVAQIIWNIKNIENLRTNNKIKQVHCTIQFTITPKRQQQRKNNIHFIKNIPKNIKEKQLRRDQTKEQTHQQKQPRL
jgi:hypothetical protein